MSDLILVRRMVQQGGMGDESPHFVIFEQGNIRNPIMLINDFEAHSLVFALVSAMSEKERANCIEALGEIE